MASKIEGRSFDAPIKSYNFDGHDYNTLRVNVDYNKSGWGGGRFEATLTPEYIEVHDGYQTRGFHITGTRDPLGSWTTIALKDAPKNSQKTIIELSAALELAKDAIAYYFDQRNWVRLHWLVESVGRSGYTPTIADLVKGDMEKGANDNANDNKNISTNQNSEDKTMTNEKKGADLIGKTIVVNGSDVKYVIKSVDGDKLMADFIMGDRTMPCPIPMSQVENMIGAGKWAIEDAPDAEASDTETKTATAEEPTAEPETTATADEVEEVQDVEEPAMTVKMQPKDKAEEPKAKTEKPKVTKGKQEPKGHKLTYSTYMNGTKEQGRISGFAETDAAYLAGRDFHGSAYPVKGVLCLSFGKAYKDFARQLCDALNAGKTVDECKAMLEKYDAERAQKKAEQRAKREARNANANESENAGGKTYTEAEVADLLKRVMEGDAEAMRIVNAMQKAA